MFRLDLSGLSSAVSNLDRNGRPRRNNQNDGGRPTWSAMKRGNNNEGRNNNRGNNFRLSSGNWSDNPLSFRGLNQKDEKRQNKRDQRQPSRESKMELDVAMLQQFVQDFTDNKTNSAALYSILQSQFVDVAKLITDKYYDPKYDNAVQEMNCVLKLFTTQLAAVALSATVKDGMYENFDEDRVYIAAFISLALDTCNSQMVDKTIGAYVEIISEYIWKNEIKEMTSRLGMEEDVAIDMVIAVPYFGRQMTEVQLRAYAPKFLSVVLDYSDSLIDTMTAENQKEWFYFIFPDINNQGLKVAGKCLSYDFLEFNDEKQNALYAEYIKMLYMILHEHDIVDIKMVLRFIVNELKRRKKEHRDNVIVFDPEYAVKCSENIEKALVDYCEKDNEARDILDQ